MNKIPTAFQRDPENRSRVSDSVTPGCEWVLAGEGVATRKYDGTCVARLKLDPADYDPGWYARREVKPGKNEPAKFHLVETDPVTGKRVGWEPIENSPFAKFHAEALDTFQGLILAPGTFELVGPKINGNPERLTEHTLIRHADAEILSEFKIDGCRNFITIGGTVAVYARQGFEGIVWHHPDGRMAKIKVRDFQ